MSPLAALLWARWCGARHALAEIGAHSRLKVAVVSSSTALLWWGAYAAARAGFALLEEYGAEWLGVGRRTLAELVMAQLLSTFALVLLVLLVLSNVVIAWGVLYRSRGMQLLMSSPAGWRTIFLGRFWECVSLSSWASLFLGSALLLAYGRAVAAPPAFYAALGVVFPAFVVLPAALGTIVAMGAALLLPRLPRPVLVALGAALAVGAFALFRRLLAAAETSGAATIQGVLVGSGAPWLPSQWAAAAVLAASRPDAAAGAGGLAAAAAPAALLWAAATLAVLLAVETAHRWLHPGWTGLRDGSPRGGWLRPPASRRRGRARGWGRRLAWLPEPYRSLSAKDARVFGRDVAQWSQFLLFFGIMALYAANMRPIVPSYQRELWQGWIAALNATVVLLVMATLTTRFVFPWISLEGRRMWILGPSPLTMRQLLLHKLVSSCALTLLFTLPLATLSGWRLGLDRLELGFSLFAVVAASLGLSGLAVGLGARLPDFRHDDPGRIVSGLGGTLNFVLSIAFVALAGAAQALVLQWHWLAPRLPSVFAVTDRREAALAAAAMLAVAALAACSLPLGTGRRHFDGVEL